MSNEQNDLNGSKHVEDPTENSHAKSSSFLDNLYLNKSDADDDTDEDAEEITSTRKRGANKIYEEKQNQVGLKEKTSNCYVASVGAQKPYFVS